MSAILAIDPGIHMGWALLKGNGKVSFGQENFNQPVGRVGQRFLALGEWLAHRRPPGQHPYFGSSRPGRGYSPRAELRG